MKANRNNRKNLSNQKGFTLIEVIIVIVLIGGLAAFFVPKLVSTGAENSAKSGANIVIEDMRAISEAGVAYATKTTQEVANTTNIETKLVAGNYLASSPVPKADLKDSAYTGTGYSYAINNSTYTTEFGTASADTVVTISGVTQQVCQKIDENFGVIAAWATPPAAVTAGKDPQCFGSGGATGYTVIKLLYSH